MPLRHTFSPPDNRRLANLCGPMDDHLRTIEAAFDVVIARRGEQFRVDGAKSPSLQAMALLEALYNQADRPLSDELVQLTVAQQLSKAGLVAARKRTGTGTSTSTSKDSSTRLATGHGSDKSAGAKPGAHGIDAEPASADREGPVLQTRRADLQGRTPNQIQYLQHISQHDLTFGIGPAGTGKTFLAVACAVDALERSAVQRIILTRIGFGTKAVVTGDVSQIDLPKGARSGLIDAQRVLHRVKGVAFTRFASTDVVRHPLVGRIVEAYDRMQETALPLPDTDVDGRDLPSPRHLA